MGSEKAYPRFTPRIMSSPNFHSSPIRGLQPCAFPPLLKGSLGLKTQSPPNSLVYVKFVPFSMKIVLPDVPLVRDLSPDLSFDESALPFLFAIDLPGPTVKIRAMTTPTTTKRPTMTPMVIFFVLLLFLLEDGSAAQRLKGGKVLWTGASLSLP